MKYVKSMAIPAIFVFTLILTNCFDSSKTGIRITVPIDRNVTSYYIKVSGPGMDTIEETFGKDVEKIVLDVPAGSSRLFEVIAYIDPSDSGAVLSFRGTATVDLGEGSSVTLPVSLRAYETKIIVPDYNNQRLIQIDDISGTNWSEMLYSDIGLVVGYLRPYDVDFDSQGRIYIANNYASSGGDTIIRIDDIAGTNPKTDISGNNSGWTSVAVDRVNNILYYSNSSTLFKNDMNENFDFNTDVQLTTTGISNISGLTADEDGFLYLTCYYSTPASNVLLKYNPSTTAVISYYSISSGTPWDALVTSDYIYVANMGGGANNLIIRLNKDFSSPTGYGVQVVSASTTKGDFYGPHRLLALRPENLTIIDDSDFDKIIVMDDITGTNWNTYGTSGTGTGQFQFYSSC